MDNIENIMTTALSNLKGIVAEDSTIVKPIYMADGTIIVPMNKISVGIASIGGEMKSGGEDKNINMPFGGGGGGGINITPMGFLVCTDGNYCVVRTDEKEKMDKWKDLVNIALKSIKK